MKVIIPAAGTGTRLFPQTHTKPKPMVYIAGKPIIGHMLDLIYAFGQLQCPEVGYSKSKGCTWVGGEKVGLRDGSE